MNIRKQLFLILLPLALAGCKRGEDYVVLPLNHPAAPTATAGVQLAGATALQPELGAVRPEIGGAGEKAPMPSTGDAHRQHRH